MEQADGVPRDVRADDIPVAHTPHGGYRERFPEPVLAGCTEPLVEGAPDLRGLWKALRVERGGQLAPPSDPMYTYMERIEQCGNRIVDMGGGTIADGRADGTFENGIHDVFALDFVTPIHVIVTYEDGAYVLRTPDVPDLAVTRRLDDDGHLVWTRPDQGFVVTMERIGDGAGTPENTFRNPFQEAFLRAQR